MPGRRCSSSDGSINWALEPFGLDGPGFGTTAVWLVESYLWLPFMILPIYAGLERIPELADQRLRGPRRSPWTTFRRVILPLAFPASSPGRSSPSR